MARREFPALGFDPAPGEPVALSEAARSADTAGRLFATASENVSRLSSSGWTGDAADAFRGRLADLPRDLDLAARSHETAARQLCEYGAGLAVRQRRADELERRAQELQRQQAAAVAEVNRIAGQHAPEGSAELESLRTAYGSARSRATGYADELDTVLGEARRLHADHRAAGASAARAIREVAHPPYRKPGRLSRALHAAEDWITRHADALTKISTVLKGVSAVLGVLCLVPGLQFLAPFALLAAGAALAIDVGIKVATGKGSWAAIGLDAALTFVPGGRILSGLKGARAAVAGERGIAAAEHAVSGADDAARLAAGSDDAIRISGGTSRPRAAGGHSEEAWDWGDEAYDNIRASDDIGAVANHVRDAPRMTGGRGFQPDEVADVKKHVFFDEHLMKGYDRDVGLRRFDANPDMAEAWLRLRTGRRLPEDVTLLEHELAELRYWREIRRQSTGRHTRRQTGSLTGSRRFPDRHSRISRRRGSGGHPRHAPQDG